MTNGKEDVVTACIRIKDSSASLIKDVPNPNRNQSTQG